MVRSSTPVYMEARALVYVLATSKVISGWFYTSMHNIALISISFILIFRAL